MATPFVIVTYISQILANVKELLGTSVLSTVETVGKPTVVGTANGGTAAYMHSCGVDYSSPVIFIPLFAAFLSIIWAGLNIQDKIRAIKERKAKNQK